MDIITPAFIIEGNHSTSKESLDTEDDFNKLVHIRCQQRNGRKCITTVSGLHIDLDYKKVLKHFKKKFSCNGSIKEDVTYGIIIQVSGDNRDKIKDFLVDNNIVKPKNIKLHGF